MIEITRYDMATDEWVPLTQEWYREECRFVQLQGQRVELTRLIHDAKNWNKITAEDYSEALTVLKRHLEPSSS